MTTPTIFSDVSGVGHSAKVHHLGVLSEAAVAVIPATTSASTDISLIKFQEGFTLVGLSLDSDDLDTSTNVVLSVGYLYEDDVANVEDDNAFLDGLDIAQDGGSRLWPVADGLLTGVSFKATGNGWLTVTTTGGATTTLGNINALVEFSYDTK